MIWFQDMTIKDELMAIPMVTSGATLLTQRKQ
jgi:hypothetical protein